MNAAFSSAYQEEKETIAGHGGEIKKQTQVGGMEARSRTRDR